MKNLLLVLLLLVSCRVKTLTNDLPLAKAVFSFVLNQAPSVRVITVETKEIDVQSFPSQIAENSTASVQVRFTNTLTASADITVSVTDSGVTVNGGTQAVLHFEPSSSTVAQTIALQAVDDMNMVSEKAKISFTSPGYADVYKDVSTVDDDTSNAFNLSAKVFRLNTGAGGQVGISLRYEPPASETVTLTSGNPTRLSLVGGSLVFNSANYNVSQNVSFNCLTIVPSKTTVTVSSSSGVASSFIVYCMPAYGANVLGLLATGQKTSNGTRDDGALQATFPHHYTDLGNGTVQDEVSGLVWQKCSSGQNNDSSCSGSASPFIWSAADLYCSKLTLASKTWRLPTIQEIATIADYSNKLGLPDKTYFPNTESIGSSTINYTRTFWSSTLYVGSPALYAWAYAFDPGALTYRDKTFAHYVRCVSGSTPASLGFVNNANILVTDNNTNLIWTRCASGKTTDAACSGGGTKYTSGILALGYCNSLPLGARTWRLPNFNERMSMIKFSANPPLDTSAFASSSDNNWTSTDKSNQFLVYFSDSTGIGDISDPLPNFHARCVSGP